MGRKKVVTWESPMGHHIMICHDCEAKLRTAGEWPRDPHGREYCQVYRGLSLGSCHLCEPEPEEVGA